ncbi:hypothetical protein KSP39_PZI024054 [Platanthera zijinensis]|uniref:Uncharacterized protein n=1 Tax=Platanthera zijinensis TaxID=2320716 RepID=A0AAP0ASP8_9ASPA
MGGASSCGSALGAASRSVRVIDSKGRAHEFFYSIRAAELMAENQGQFVCDSTNLQVGCRVPGLAADEELLHSRLYFLLPTDLLFSVLTEEEMAWLLRRVAGATTVRRRRRRRRSKVISISLMKTGEVEERKKAEEGRRCGGVLAMERLRSSWEPALDTIEE